MAKRSSNDVANEGVAEDAGNSDIPVALLERARVVSALLDYGIALTAEAKAMTRDGKTAKEAGVPSKAAINHLERAQLLWNRFTAAELETENSGGGSITELEPAVLNALSAAWQAAGERDRALHFEELSVAALLRIHGEGTPHPDIAFALHGLAVALKQCRKREDATEKCKESLGMMQDLNFPDTHPGVRLAAALLHELL